MFPKYEKFKNALWSGKNFGICVLYFEWDKIKFKGKKIK